MGLEAMGAGLLALGIFLGLIFGYAIGKGQ